MFFKVPREKVVFILLHCVQRMSLVFFYILPGVVLLLVEFIKTVFMAYYGYYTEGWADFSLSLMSNSWTFILEAKVIDTSQSVRCGRGV